MSQVELVKRKIVVASQQFPEPQIVESSAKTWKELKVDLLAANISLTNTKALLKSNKSTLEVDDALVPTGDQILYLFEEKVKSGMDYSTMTYNQLRSEASKRGLLAGKASMGKAETIALLKKDDKKSSKKSASAPAPKAKVEKKEASKPVEKVTRQKVVKEVEINLEEQILTAVQQSLSSIKLNVSEIVVKVEVTNSLQNVNVPLGDSTEPIHTIVEDDIMKELEELRKQTPGVK